MCTVVCVFSCCHPRACPGDPEPAAFPFLLLDCRNKSGNDAESLEPMSVLDPTGLDRISFWWKQLVLPPKAVNPIDSKEIDQFYILCRHRNTIPTKDELI